VDVSCHPVDDGNYLVREFKVRIAGRPAVSGTQRIAWDSLSRHFRVWTFDSKGGFLEGAMYGDGERWTLRSSGQTAHAKPVSTAGVFAYVNSHTMTWQNIEYIVDGEEAPPAAPVKIVRKPPRQQATSQ